MPSAARLAREKMDAERREAARRAHTKFKQEDLNKDLVAGIDVAGPGENETTCFLRNRFTGNIFRMKAWPSRDPRGQCVNFLSPYRDRLHKVFVDMVGTGYYFALHLQDQDFPVSMVNVGLPSSEPKRYVNLKAEIYWGLRLSFAEDQVGGLTDEQTISQLTAIEYRYDDKGRVEIESKEELRDRGVPSPDRAEGLMLTYTPSRKARRRHPLPESISTRQYK